MQPYDVTSSFVQVVDAERTEAEDVLSRIDPMRSPADLAYSLIWRFDAEGSRARTLASWTLLEELVRGYAQRLARTVGEYASADDYEVAAPPLLAAV